MNHTSPFESAPGFAADTLLLTAVDGLVPIGDLAEGLEEGQGRRLAIKLRGDDCVEKAVGVVACGRRSAYRTMLENGMTFVSTYNSCLVTARNRHSHHHIRSIEQLTTHDTAVVPRGPSRMGRYDGKAWGASMLDRGALPSKALAGNKAYLRKVVRSTLLEPVGGMGEGIRSTLSTTDENDVILTWLAPNKWIGRQMQVLLVPFANAMSEFNERTLVMTVRDGDLARLDAATGVIDGIYDEGECSLDRQTVDWLLGLEESLTRAREVVRVDGIEGVNRREMYAIVLASESGTFNANGTLHTPLKTSPKTAIEWVE